MKYALLVVGFILFVGFFVVWYGVTLTSRIKKKTLKKTYLVLWCAGIPAAIGGVAMIIIGLLVK